MKAGRGHIFSLAGMVKTSGSQDFPARSNTKMLSAATLPPLAASCGSNESGALENTSSGHESASSAHSKSNSEVRIEWAPWRLSHAQFHYRQRGVVDLGDLTGK